MKEQIMTSIREKYPLWARKALQGVTYWMGHRRCLYRNHPLSEGALVAEICNLIHANLHDKKLSLKCEVQYSDFFDPGKKPKEIDERTRADLVVYKKTINAEDASKSKIEPKFIIEVKRAGSGKKLIDEDLRYLAIVREKSIYSIRTFLFVISEAKLPKRFVNEEGMLKIKKGEIPKSNADFRVYLFKAASAFTKRDHAHYACLIEVRPR